jgi:hypothetical protein
VAKQLTPKGDNDDIQTPRYLANQIVKHFLPLIDVKNDLVFEPSVGKGDFVRPMLMTTPNDWKQNGCARRRKSSSRQ